MGEVVALARTGTTAVPDVRRDRRELQISWHEVDDVFVISLWRAGRCTGAVRIGPEAAAEVIGALADGLAERG
jgi:hypothetical protein